jgi:hypothetical protein
MYWYIGLSIGGIYMILSFINLIFSFDKTKLLLNVKPISSEYKMIYTIMNVMLISCISIWLIAFYPVIVVGLIIYFLKK